jgi:hypothetical protein
MSFLLIDVGFNLNPAAHRKMTGRLQVGNVSGAPASRLMPYGFCVEESRPVSNG